MSTTAGAPCPYPWPRMRSLFVAVPIGVFAVGGYLLVHARSEALSSGGKLASVLVGILLVVIAALMFFGFGGPGTSI